MSALHKHFVEKLSTVEDNVTLPLLFQLVLLVLLTPERDTSFVVLEEDQWGGKAKVPTSKKTKNHPKPKFHS
jgi:hypothetical protein